MARVTMNDAEVRGTLAGMGCYALWGVLPTYWKLLAEVDSAEIVAHRIIWCWAGRSPRCRWCCSRPR